MTYTNQTVVIGGIVALCGTVFFGLAIKDALGHSWYSDLRTPMGASCCSDHDCQPVPHRETPGGLGVEIFVGGRWVAVDPWKVVGIWSPDGQVHACCVGPQKCETLHALPRCVVLLGRGV